MQSVSEPKMQLFENVLQQTKLNDQSYVFSNTPEPYEMTYREIQVRDIEYSIVFMSQEIKKLKRQVKDSSDHWQEMIFIQNKLRKNDLNDANLLKYIQITKHPLIQSFKQKVKIAELKLDTLTLLPDQDSSHIAVATNELMLQKKRLAWQLVLFTSSLESNINEIRHELDKLKP